MARWRAVLLIFGCLLLIAPASAAPLVPFADANGCKLLAQESIVKRLQEIAALGKIIWDGQCRGGLIEGRGVLREEGTVSEGGKTKKFAYFFSGNARKGLREGTWQRETFERFIDSPRFYTSAAVVDFAGGVVKGKLRLLTITQLDQLSPAFRQFVIEAQRDARPANEALVYAPPVSPAPAAVSAPATSAVPPAAPQVPARAAADLPKSVPQPASAPRVTASSQLQQFGPEGLLASAPPAWHSKSPPDYPEWVMVDFRTSREIRSLGLLPQEQYAERAPKVIRLEFSDDGRKWTPMPAAERPCALDPADSWSNLKLPSPARSRYLKIYILSNCGDPSLVTVRGFRFD
jgi:hypothetical protein